MAAAKDQVVVLTGANSGIGLALARALHAEGRRVACVDIAADHLTGLRFIACDVTVPAEVEAAVETVVRDWGRIDVLVNNACLAVFAPLEERDLATTRREFEVDFYGYLHLIAAVVPHMKRQVGGVIHNVGSTVGSTGVAGLSGYASTKGAIEAIGVLLARLVPRPMGAFLSARAAAARRAASGPTA